jgi:putative ABC transport system permease protein
MLGSATLRQLRKSVGDDVTIAIGDSAVKARVVGRTVLPALGRVDTRRAGLGDGVVMSAATFTRLADGFHPAAVVVRLTPHAPAGAVARLRGALGDQTKFERSYGPQRPADLVSGASGPASRLLVGLLGLAAAASLAHTLLGAVRQRRRDLAILKTLGFERRQLSRVVASLATTLLVTALVVGIPAGLVIGGWSWRLFADRLGVLPTTVVPLFAILATVPAALAAANVVAAVPAWSAARTNPAGVLRSE